MFISSKNIKKLAIIPAYNEEDNIGSVIRDLTEERPDYDIIIINDGSTDRTSELARELRVTVIDLPFNQGIGAAMQTGYKYAHRNGYDIAVQFDGDGQHRADQIRYIEGPVLEGLSDLVVGSRFIKAYGYKSGLARRFGIKIISFVLSVLTRQKVTDPTSGFRAAGVRAIEFFSRLYPDDYPEPESVLLLHKAGMTFREVPVMMRERSRGKSSITPLRASYYMVKVILAMMIDSLKKVPMI